MLTLVYYKLVQALSDVFIHDPMAQTTEPDELYNWGAHNYLMSLFLTTHFLGRNKTEKIYTSSQPLSSTISRESLLYMLNLSSINSSTMIGLITIIILVSVSTDNMPTIQYPVVQTSSVRYRCSGHIIIKPRTRVSCLPAAIGS